VSLLRVYRRSSIPLQEESVDEGPRTRSPRSWAASSKCQYTDTHDTHCCLRTRGYGCVRVRVLVLVCVYVWLLVCECECVWCRPALPRPPPQMDIVLKGRGVAQICRFFFPRGGSHCVFFFPGGHVRWLRFLADTLPPKKKKFTVRVFQG
jgi:hypothetical protein